ncbi:hypothetical protein BB561_005660 [Smittium simulii]|uniref:Uncharacterized protein n=1 Tax=Smittium simulii TaxID=133385 RepID=A0A2T9Y9A6_9FUNG|nr:hypothetical protein BB561_005660 [Smittium simulii]
MFSIKYLLPFFVLIQALFYCAAVSNGSGLDLDKRAPESPPTGHNYKRMPQCSYGGRRCRGGNGYTICSGGKERYASCGRGTFCKGSGSCVYSRQD